MSFTAPPPLTPTERAQLAMMLEVTAYPKPGNVDRCHDYPDTRLEHFLASTILVRPVFEKAEAGEGSVGQLIKDAVRATNVHSGGNTHFGAFLLLIPLLMGKTLKGAQEVIEQTTVDDAVTFYEAFALTRVRLNDHFELDVNDPHTLAALRKRGLTLKDVLTLSAPRDMVAREWTNGFALTDTGAQLLKAHGCGRASIVAAFLELLATEMDTFVIKKHGEEVAREVLQHAREVKEGLQSMAAFDETLIARGINPGSLADILIASIYLALGEGWQWDC
jgi:triphosphoribosyl-dephospho-CoA synthase